MYVCTYTLHCIFTIIRSCHPLLNDHLLLRSCTAHTFGDSILMTSFRKRNFPNSAWNLCPQFFTHASRTWHRRRGIADTCTASIQHHKIHQYTQPSRDSLSVLEGPTSHHHSVSSWQPSLRPSEDYVRTYVDYGNVYKSICTHLSPQYTRLYTGYCRLLSLHTSWCKYISSLEKSPLTGCIMTHLVL